MINNYSKRIECIYKSSVGRNNLGTITVRGRQKIKFVKVKLKNKNYNYLFFKVIKKHLNINKIIKIKILRKVVDYKIQKYVYLCLILNGVLKNNYSYLPLTLKVNEGEIIFFGKNNFPSIKLGSILPINLIPLGGCIHNIESIPFNGSVFVKNSRKSGFLIFIGKKYATIKLPSGEIRFLNKNVFCIYGEINIISILNKKKNAGLSRLLGKRPKLRGVAVNASDHPHGGGKGKHSIGSPFVCSPWGFACKGVLTRNKKKYSRNLILKK